MPRGCFSIGLAIALLRRPGKPSRGEQAGSFPLGSRRPKAFLPCQLESTAAVHFTCETALSGFLHGKLENSSRPRLQRKNEEGLRPRTRAGRCHGFPFSRRVFGFSLGRHAMVYVLSTCYGCGECASGIAGTGVSR